MFCRLLFYDSSVDMASNPKSTKTTNYMTEISPDIVKNSNLEIIVSRLYEALRGKENNSPQLINNFFNQWIFKWSLGLIDELVKAEPNITFEYMKDEWINLALLYYNDLLRDFNDCLENTSNDVKQAIIDEIFDKVQSQIWTSKPYDKFSTECAKPVNWNPTHYFTIVVDYLNNLENAPWWKKVKDILKEIIIRNEDINLRLPAWSRINPTIPISYSVHPKETIKSFDALLSFEIWKEAVRAMNIAENVKDKLSWLFSNTFPAINTIIWEDEELRYDEKKLRKLYNIPENQDLSDKEKWEYYLKYLESKDKKIRKVLKSLKDNNFNYSKLDESELTWYLKKIADLRVRKLFDSGLEKSLKLNFGNLDEFKKFYVNLADPSSKSLDFWWWIVLPIEKTIDTDDHGWLSELDQYGSKSPSFDALPINYKIKKKHIDELKISQEDKINLLNFLSIYQVREEEKEFNDANPREFVEYCKANNIKRKDGKPIDEKCWLDPNAVFVSGWKIFKLIPKSWANTADDYGSISSYIFVRETDKETEYIINWDNAWSLMYLYFIINSKIPITEINLEEQKKVEELFWKSESKNPTKEKAEEEAKEDEKKKSDTEKFMNGIEALWSWTKFENWSEIWVPIWNSEIPWWWYKWMKIKVSDINKNKWTFKWTVSWWELKFKSNLEWKSKTFKMNEKTLNDIKNISKADDKICLLPNPEKSDFESFIGKLGNKLWNSSFKFPDGVEWKNKKFIHNFVDNWKNVEKEVEHFWVLGDDSVSYKIKYNPNKRSFNVSTSFLGKLKSNDWKSSEDTKFSYSRDMDWNNFIIFFTQKPLIPQSPEDSKKAEENQRIKMMNWWGWKLNWFSISNLKNVFKTIKWNINKKLEEYNKSQESKLEDIIIWDWWLYGKLGNILWFIPSMKSSFWELQREYYNDRDNRSWKKIEYYYKLFQWDPDFWTTFDQITPYAKTKWWKSYKQIITGLFESKRDLWDGDIQMAAGLLLANIEKWWSPYRWLSEYENNWYWVKVLLWDAHYQQFLRDKAACINARNIAEDGKGRWLDKNSLNNQLATCEMDYIINNIRWSYGKAAYSFWSVELRWLNWDKSTNYVDNPSKRLFSDQFAGKLADGVKWWFNASSVETAYWKYKDSINNFEIAEAEFGKLWSWRYKNAAAALMRMRDLSSDDSLKWRTERCLLTYLLSWVLDIYSDKWLKDQIYKMCKPMSFVPWLLTKERNVAENIAIFLDEVFDGDFSKNVDKYFHKEYLEQNKWIQYSWLKEQLDNWLTDEKINKLHEYFEKLPCKDFSNRREPQRTILEKFKNSLVSDARWEIDRRAFDQPVVVNNWLLTNIEVISNMTHSKDWEFEWKDSDEINDKKAFWRDVKRDIDNRLDDTEDEKVVDFVLNTYLSRFWLTSTDDRQDIFKRINTAKQYKDLVNKGWWTYKCHHKLRLENWNIMDVPLWEIKHEDVNKVLLYGLEWKAYERLCRIWWWTLPWELKEALDSFQKFFYRAFKSWTLTGKVVKNWALKSWNLWWKDCYLLWWWDAYKKINEKQITNTNDEVDDSSGDAKFFDLKHGQRKEVLRRVFRNEDFEYVNPYMETMYKSLTRNRNSLWDERSLKIGNNTETNPQGWDLNTLYDSLNE